MKIHWMVILVTFMRLAEAGWPCCCRGGTPVNPEDPNILDVANIDTLRVRIKEERETVLIPKSPYIITEVVEGPTTIWEAEGDETCSLVRLSRESGRLVTVKLSILVDDGTTLKTFKRDGQEWKLDREGDDARASLRQVRQAQLYGHYEEPSGAAEGEKSEKPAEGPKEADTAPEDPSGADAKEPEEGPGATNDGESGTATEDVPSTSYPSTRPGKIIKRPSLRLELIPRVELDVANPNKEEVYVGYREKNGIKYQTFFPRKDFCISSVVDRGVPIWTGGKDEKCYFMEFYEAEGCMILYVETGRRHKFRSCFYEKVEGEWKEIKREDFAEKLQTIRMSKGDE